MKQTGTASPFSPSVYNATAQSTASSSTPPPPTPRPSSLGGSRLGPTKMDWRIIPVTNTLVRFDLDGLGDPFYRVLGKRLTVDYGDPEAVTKVIEAGGADVEEMATRLESVWNDYKLQGAILWYRWSKDLRYPLTGRIISGDELEDDEPQDTYEDDRRKPPTILRALDLLLVMNVLARTRANILLKNAPLALERQYLGQSLFTDDARMISLAQATGCVEEALK
jgi:hypothetical protein